MFKNYTTLSLGAEGFTKSKIVVISVLAVTALFNSSSSLLTSSINKETTLIEKILIKILINPDM